MAWRALARVFSGPATRADFEWGYSSGRLPSTRTDRAQVASHLRRGALEPGRAVTSRERWRARPPIRIGRLDSTADGNIHRRSREYGSKVRRDGADTTKTYLTLDRQPSRGLLAVHNGLQLPSEHTDGGEGVNDRSAVDAQCALYQRSCLSSAQVTSSLCNRKQLKRLATHGLTPDPEHIRLLG